MSAACTVRQAEPRDVAAAAALFDRYRQFYEQAADLPLAQAFIAERLERGDSWIALAWRGDGEAQEALGLVQCYPLCSSTAKVPGPAMLLSDLFVSEAARGHGVARALMQAAEAHARAAGCVGMELSTAKTNHRAQALYVQQGWQRDEVFFVYAKSLLP